MVGITWSSIQKALPTAGSFFGIALLGFMSLLAGCGGGGGGGSPGAGSPTLTSINVAPATASVVAGLTLHLTAAAMYSDGSQKDVTSSATWASSAIGIATVSASGGVATGVSEGTSSIGATWNGVTGKNTLTVTAAALVSLAISPNAPNIAVHKTLQFTATGTYTDGSTHDMTSTAVWTSSNPAVATISTAGLADASITGTTQIGASIPGGASASPVQLTVTSKMYAYATNFDEGTVSQYVLSSDGSLTPLSTPAVAAGTQPFSISVEPTGEYVYVSNWTSSNVSQYRIGADGTLSAVGSGTVATGSHPNAVTIDHADRFAYVANYSDNTISQFKIGMDGALSPMATRTVASGSNPASLTVDPTSHFAYVANFGTGSSTPPANPSTISQYLIGSDGSLTPMSAPTVAAGRNPDSLVVDPSGKYLYVTNQGDNQVGQYLINSDGSLSAMTSAATVVTGGAPVGIVVDPTSRYAYVANQQTSNISQYSIGMDGSLTPMSTPVAAGPGVSSVTIDPTGTYLYATNRGTNTISQYTIGTTGLLTPMATLTAPAGTHPTAIAIGY